jgi:chemotaxis response regulator CheB
MISEETKIIPQPKVLIVEDDLMEQKVMSANISRYGYICETALSGKERTENARLFGADVIILDLFLPDVSGKRRKKIKMNGNRSCLFGSPILGDEQQVKGFMLVFIRGDSI